MAMIQNDWLDAIGGEFRKPYYKELYQFVKEEYHTHVIYPPADDIFNAFHLTPLSEVKVMILGQDPYHNAHQAHVRMAESLSDPVIPRNRVRHPYRIFIKNCMMTAAVISRIMVIWKSGPDRVS